MDLRIGCCGFPVSRKRYYRNFGLVELEKTFYEPLRPRLAEKLRESAPEDFEFTVKAWQVITHPATSPGYRMMKKVSKQFPVNTCGYFRPTDEVFRAWEATERVASILGSRIIVFQCPASFTPDAEHKADIKKFFRTIDRKHYKFALELGKHWPEDDIRDLCEGLDLIHCVDPFTVKKFHGEDRYFRLRGRLRRNYRYKGLGLKQLRDLCENEAALVGDRPIYVLFNNDFMFDDAKRFEWIVENTGRIREVSLDILKDLCREIEAQEEDEKVQLLSREAERIVMLILHTEYQKVDIEIEKDKLREMCNKLFPGKEDLFDMIYGRRFDRLWVQFRKKKRPIGE